MAEELERALQERQQALHGNTPPAGRFLHLLGALAICKAALDLRK